MLERVKVFASCVQDKAFDLLAPFGGANGAQALTPMEIECLRWSADGLGPAEIGDRTNSSEATTIAHLRSAMQKLDCVSRYQAVIKAIRMGLIK